MFRNLSSGYEDNIPLADIGIAVLQIEHFLDPIVL
jgi:hypothetical protein